MSKNRLFSLIITGMIFVVTVISCNKAYMKNVSSLNESNCYYVQGFPQDQKREGLILLEADSYLQTTEYTCGPAAVITLLGYFGRKGDEMLIAQEMGTSQTCGTTPEQMTIWLNEHGFTANWYENGNLDTLQFYLGKELPILVEWSDWGGHWVLAVGYDNRNTEDLMDDVIIFADPYDYHDGNKDGKTWFNAQRFYYMWYDALLFGRTMKGIYIVAKPS